MEVHTLLQEIFGSDATLKSGASVSIFELRAIALLEEHFLRNKEYSKKNGWKYVSALCLRHGFCDGESKTFAQIAKVLGLSAGRTQLIYCTAIRTLCEKRTYRLLKPMVDPETVTFRHFEYNEYWFNRDNRIVGKVVVAVPENSVLVLRKENDNLKRREKIFLRERAVLMREIAAWRHWVEVGDDNVARSNFAHARSLAYRTDKEFGMKCPRCGKFWLPWKPCCKKEE